MRALATSVVVVTSWLEDAPWGLTVSACCSVSASPPMLLISVGAHTVTARSIRKHGVFGVNILSEDQTELAALGSRPQTAKFCAEYCVPGPRLPGSAPAVLGALAHFDCRVIREVDAADHTIFIGSVRRATRTAGTRPLLWFDQSFRRLGDGDVAAGWEK